MNHDTQIVKGILEGCLLKIIEEEAVYGYGAVEKLNRIGFEVNEATVYPILSRLQNKGYLEVEKRLSPLGPARKYYFLTEQGDEYLRAFRKTWTKISRIVDAVMGGERHDPSR